MSASILFSGIPGNCGGLSNEKKIANLCPAEFKARNPWSDYCEKISKSGANISNWIWRSKDKEEKANQLSCFWGLKESVWLDKEKKMAIMCWMLSEMLADVPDYLPSKNG